MLAARLVGLVFVMFVGVAVGGEFNPVNLKGVEPIQTVFFWTAFIGMVFGRWPGIGGALSLGGMVLFFAGECAVRGGLPRGLLLHLTVLPGILFLLSTYTRRRMAAGG